MGANGGKNSGCASGREWKTDRENESHLTLLLAMRNLLIIAESKWAPSPRCLPMTEQWRLCRCSTSDYFLYPWVISNLRSTLSKRLDITRRTPMKITEFLLEEEADDNKNLRCSLCLIQQGKDSEVITTLLSVITGTSICFGWVCAESCWNMERLRIVDHGGYW